MTVRKKNIAVPMRGKSILYEENPFVMSMTTKTKRVINKKGDMALINTGTGEIQSEIAGFWESHVVDDTKFIKLFVKGVAALKELTQSGTKVFEVLYMNVQTSIGKDKIYMSFRSVDQDVCPMSEATYTRGLRELVEKKFLAAAPDIGQFWLNPDYIWNGDRLAFLTEFRKASAKPRNFLNGDLFEGLENKETVKPNSKKEAKNG